MEAHFCCGPGFVSKSLLVFQYLQPRPGKFISIEDNKVLGTHKGETPPWGAFRHKLPESWGKFQLWESQTRSLYSSASAHESKRPVGRGHRWLEQVWWPVLRVVSVRPGS